MIKGDIPIKLIRSNKGSSTVIFVCSAVFIILLSAVITDIGYIAVERYKMDRIVDRIAEIGATAMITDKDECVRLINENAVKSIKNITKLDVKVSDNNREMSINMERKLDYIFLKYIGFNDKKISSIVSVKVSNVTSYKGIRPFAVAKSDLEYGKQYYLYTSKEKPSNLSKEASFLRLIPINIGKGSFETGIIYGFNNTVKSGDIVYPLAQADVEGKSKKLNKLIEKCKGEPACTYDNYEDGCPRIIIIPVVDREEESVEKGMKILGFTAFFIEDGNYGDGKDKEGIELKGRFIKYTVKSSTSDGVPDFGLLGIKLKHW
jgi:Flp pilus assembly protein TadG